MKTTATVLRVRGRRGTQQSAHEFVKTWDHDREATAWGRFQAFAFAFALREQVVEEAVAFPFGAGHRLGFGDEPEAGREVTQK